MHTTLTGRCSSKSEFKHSHNTITELDIFMVITLGELYELLETVVREKSMKSYAGSHPTEAYDHSFEDDPAYKERSDLVPDDIKDDIKKWSSDMGLSAKKRNHRI